MSKGAQIRQNRMTERGKTAFLAFRTAIFSGGVILVEVRELTAGEEKLWDDLVASSPQRSVFAQRWWMEIVTRGRVRLLGCFNKRQLIGGLPVWPCSILGVRRLRLPPLTPYWGPVLSPIAGKMSTRLSTEMSILRALAEALRPWPDIQLQFHPTLANWLPFYWEGFSQTTRYTYRIENWQEHVTREQVIHTSIRAELKKAEKCLLSTQEGVDPSIPLHMAKLSMERQGLESSHEIVSFWPALMQAARERGCLFTLAVTDPDSNVHAAVADVWDDRCTYGILGGNDPQYRSMGGYSLCLMQELAAAQRVAPAYDFEGSMIEGVEGFFRRFGGELVPYHAVSRSTSLRLNAARVIQATASRTKQWLLQRLWRKSRIGSSETKDIMPAVLI